MDLQVAISQTNSSAEFNQYPDWKKEVISKIVAKGFCNATVKTITEVTGKMNKKLLYADGITNVFCHKVALMSINRNYRNAKAKAEGKTSEETVIETRTWGKKFGHSFIVNDNRYIKDKKTGERTEKLPNKMYLAMYSNPDCIWSKKYVDQNGKELDDIDVEKYWNPSALKDYGNAVKGYGEYDLNNIVGVKCFGKVYGDVTR